jgi:hypothetical protein
MAEEEGNVSCVEPAAGLSLFPNPHLPLLARRRRRYQPC